MMVRSLQKGDITNLYPVQKLFGHGTNGKEVTMLKFKTVCQYIYLMCDLIYELKLDGQIQTLKSIGVLE